MTDDTIISVKDVSMRFNLAREKVDSLKEYIIRALRGKLQYDEFWALSDVCFDVKKAIPLDLSGLTEAARAQCSNVLPECLSRPKEVSQSEEVLLLLSSWEPVLT